MLEALIASVILLMTVVATASAIHAGRQYALEGQDQVNSTLIADALMAEILAQPYADLPGFHGMEDAPGTLTTVSGTAYPATYNRVGRRVEVASASHTIPNIGEIQGLDVTVIAYNVEGRILCTLKRFVAAP